MLTQDPRQARDYFAQKLAYLTGPFELSGQIKRNEPITIVDVRLPSDFQAGHIPGAINLPHGKVDERNLAAYPADTLFVVYCSGQHCNGADRAAARLARLGRRVKKMIGGIEGWKDEGFRLVGADRA